ncbi:hypothetical protein D3C79_860780 [compost metagenome]
MLARPFAFEGEAGAQRFMAGDQLVEGSAQGGDIQRAAQAQHAGNVVGAAFWGQLPQQPLALLGVRQRQLVARGLHRQGQRRSLLQLRQGLAEVTQARLVEHQAQGEIQRQLMAQARDCPRHQQRMAAQGEEIITQPDAFGL